MNKSMLARAVMTAALGLASASAFALTWPSSWTADNSNTPVTDKSGDCSISSPSTSTSASFKFHLTTKNTGSTTQRCEFKYERRSGYTKTTGDFVISSSYPNFYKIAIAQTHDNSTGSGGVFTIYGVTKESGKYYFGYQTDSKSWTKLKEIKLGTTYNLKIQTNSKSSAYETAYLYSGSTLMTSVSTTSGGESSQYRKLGAYRLTSGYGPIYVTWKNVKHYTGK